MGVLIEPLSKLYQFQEYSAVAAFVQANPFLQELLEEGREKIREHFGDETQVALEVFVDPEDQREKELLASVQTRLSPEDAWARLGRLDQAWWLEACSRARGLLSIHIEYI